MTASILGTKKPSSGSLQTPRRTQASVRTGGLMIRSRSLAVLVFTLAFVFASSAWAALTLDDIKAMVSAEVPDSIVVSTIQNSEEVFNLSAQQIIDLKKVGVSDAVIEALQATSGSVTRSADAPREDERSPESSSKEESRERRPREDESRSRRGRDDDNEDDGSIIRRRRGREDDGDRDRDREESRSSKVKRTPKEIKAAIANYKEKKYLNSSLKLFRLLESGKYPEHEARINYYLGASLKQLGLLHSAQFYFQKVVKEGPSSGALFSTALAKIVEISDRTRDPIFLIRTIDRIDPDDYPGRVKDDLYYYQGVRDFEKKNYNRAKRNFAKLGRASRHFIQARYHLGVIYNNQDRRKQAYKTFADIVNRDFRGNTGDVAAIKQLSFINMARIRYSVEQFQKAAQLYDRLPRLTANWPTALYEEAWAHFMSENQEGKTFGNLLTLNSPFFDRYWAPESAILEALTYYRICEYQLVENILDRFKADFEPVQTNIDELLEPYASGERPFRNLYERLYSRRSKDFRKLPVALYARVEANRIFAGPHNRVLQIERELARIKQLKSQWRNSEVGKALAKLLKSQRKTYMKFAGVALANELGEARNQLADLMGQEALIRFEVVSGEYKKYQDRFRNPESADVQEGVEFDFATNPYMVYWPFNDEYWEDELGYFERSEPGDCKE